MLICQLTDLHLCPPGEAAYPIVDTNAFAERAFEAVASFDPKPDAIVITGDLTECGLDSEYQLFRSLVERHGLGRVHVIPGNHDDRDRFRANLGDMPGVDRNERFVQYVVDEFPVRLVMLDTIVNGAAHGILCEDRLAFLDRALEAAPDRPTMIAMHHPPFTCGIEHMDRINLTNADAFTSVIARHPQVERIICGHHHRPVFARVGCAIASTGPSVAHQIELSLAPRAAGALILEPPAFHLHRWTRNAGFVTHHAYVDDHPGPYSFVDCPASPCPG